MYKEGVFLGLGAILKMLTNMLWAVLWLVVFFEAALFVEAELMWTHLGKFRYVFTPGRK